MVVLSEPRLFPQKAKAGFGMNKSSWKMRLKDEWREGREK